MINAAQTFEISFFQCSHCTGRDLWESLNWYCLSDADCYQIISQKKWINWRKKKNREGERDWQRLQRAAPRWELGDRGQALGFRAWSVCPGLRGSCSSKSAAGSVRQVCGLLGRLLTGEAQDQDAEKAFMVHKCLIASALKYLMPLNTQTDKHDKLRLSLRVSC